MAGAALGSFVAPGIGTVIGRQLGSAATKLFELESEGMTLEQEQFEVARRVVRLTAASAKNAATAPPSAPPRQVATQAIARAAKVHAPGLVRPLPQRDARGRFVSSRPQQRGGGGRPGPARQRPQQARPQYSRAVQRPVYTGGAALPSGGSSGYSGHPGRRMSGRWVRRGRKILVLGA
jgi:hypothetical protein